jgi:PAS domain S-box-containing protein
MIVDDGRRAGARSWLGLDDPQTCLRIARHPHVRASAGLAAFTALAAVVWSGFTQGRELQVGQFAALHGFFEIFSIVACVMVFVAARAPSGASSSRNMAMLGALFLGVALLDLLHTFSYPGMPDLVTPSGPEKAIAFWLAARLMAAGALVAAAFMDWSHRVRTEQLDRWAVIVLAGVGLFALLVLLRPHWLPRTFVEGEGLTPFKITMEIVVIALLLASAAGFCRQIEQTATAGAKGFDPVALMTACLVAAIGEVFFTLYRDVNGLFNVIGHVYKMIGAWFLYRGLVAATIFEVETRAKLALEGAQLGAWSWDPVTDLVELDQKAAAAWGLPSTATVPLSVLDARVAPEQRASRRAAMERALRPDGSGAYLADFQIRLADGTTRYLVSRATTAFQRGKPHRMIGVVRDDTQRRKADEAERRLEAKLSGILSIAADAIISIDGQHRIVLFNQGAEKIFGYAGAEVLGKPLDMLIPTRFRGPHRGHVATFAASGTTAQRMGERREVAGLRKDGNEFPAEASISKLALDGEITYTVVLRDVTERKRLELELEQRVAQRTAELSALLDAVPDGIVQTDISRRIRVPNAALGGMFGYSRDELVGMHARRLFASEADADAVATAWRTLEQGGTFEPVTVACRRQDGSTFTAMVRGSVVRDGNGKQLGRVGIIRDVTDELKRQQALAVAQRMEAFGQLTGGLAHDFNNLLTVISGNHELLEMRLKDERDLALLKRSQAAAEMGARLTSRLLSFARRKQLAPELLSLNEQITSMVDLLRRSIGEQITLTTNLSPRLPLVKADPSEVENAVLNLAINARDAMPQGGTIVIETSEHIVDAGGLAGEARLKPGRYVRLSVTDTGRGMPPAVAARAFEPFFTTKAHGKGTGLGLSTIHGFAQQSGGTATLYSEPERGTTVSIYLPQVDAEGRHAPLLEADETLPPAKGERVLLVEDNAEVRELARVLLLGLGYVVEAVDGGVRALELLKRGGKAFDLVFCDVVMPGGVSGYDVARWVASNLPRTRVLLTSGYPDEVANGQGVTVDAVRLLRKPYSRLELAQTLRQVLDG